MSYESRILSLSPVLYIPFTETSGTTFADITGNSHDTSVVDPLVTAGGGDSFLCGEKAGELSFAGGGGFGRGSVSMANPSTIPFWDTAFTYEVWTRPNSLRIIVSFFTSGHTEIIFGDIADVGGGNQIQVIALPNVSISDIDNTAPRCWHYYCLSYDGSIGGALKYYIDGVPFAGSTNTSLPIAGAPTSFFVTERNLSPVFVNHLAAYDYQLTDAQVAANYAAALPRCDNPCFGIRNPNFSQVYLKQS